MRLVALFCAVAVLLLVAAILTDHAATLGAKLGLLAILALSVGVALWMREEA